MHPYFSVMDERWFHRAFVYTGSVTDREKTSTSAIAMSRSKATTATRSRPRPTPTFATSWHRT